MHNNNAIGKVETMKARDVSKIDLQIKTSFFSIKQPAASRLFS